MNHTHRFTKQLIMLVLIIAFAQLGWRATPVPLQAQTISLNLTVNSTTDAPDASPGNAVCATSSGFCTLRAAIQEANAMPGEDTITLPSGRYVLSIGGRNEDAAATGDLDVTDALIINGAGADKTFLDGNGIDRVLDLTGGFDLTLTGVTVQHGDPGSAISLQTDGSPQQIDPASGGGILNMGVLLLTNVAISENRADLGGGIYNLGIVRPRNVTISGNSTALSGGGVTNLGIFKAENTTISTNTTAGKGGGLFVADGSIVVLENTTVHNNSAANGGGIFGDNVQRLEFERTIIAGNGTDNCLVSGTLLSEGYNLDSDNTCGLTGTGDRVNSDPRLGPLQNNGGSTATHALLMNSPAIDTAGTAFCPATDQRGIPRPQGSTCDIGAYERKTVSTSTIRGQVTDASGNPLMGVAISDGAGHTALTDSNGNYILSGIQDGSVTLTPARGGYTFTPTALTVQVPPDATGKNFTATAVATTYSISGQVSDVSGQPLANVTVFDGSGGQAVTNSNGQYTLSNKAIDTYTLIPVKDGYTFSPPSRQVTLPPAAVDQQFVATAVAPPAGGDTYEPNDTCPQAQPLDTTGTIQEHAFYQPADTDWVRFEVKAGNSYLIEARVPNTSPADVAVEVYPGCDKLPQSRQDHTFSPGVRLEFVAPTTGSIFMKLVHRDAATGGSDVTYQLSVRDLTVAPSPGALILVAGRFKQNDPLQPHIHHVAHSVYRTFQNQGYTHDQIYFLASDLGIDNVDALATAANLRAAITEWAPQKVDANRPLTIYLIDHGNYDLLYLDKPRAQEVTAQQLSTWLSDMERQQPEVKTNIIVEACYSGSFIDLSHTASKSGRVVITSTGANHLAWASSEGALFSDHFLAALGRGSSLYASFQAARNAVQATGYAQTPWIDDNGNGQPNEPHEGQISQQRGFGFAGTLSDEEWPPYIAQVQPITKHEIRDGQGVIRAQVLDDKRVKRVWAVIYPPTYQPPTVSEEMIRETLPTVVLLDQGDGWYSAAYPGFTEEGDYRVVVYAEDGDSLEAQPRATEVRTGLPRVYLPLVNR
jgi:CSLREA domain-containing protein